MTDDPLDPETRKRVDYLLASDFFHEHLGHDLVMDWGDGDISESVLRCPACSVTWPNEDKFSVGSPPGEEVARVRPGEWAWFQKKTPTPMAYVGEPMDARNLPRTETFHRRVRVYDKSLILTTQSGEVRVSYPTWLAIDDAGYPYPIAPEEHAKTYKPVATANRCSCGPTEKCSECPIRVEEPPPVALWFGPGGVDRPVRAIPLRPDMTHEEAEEWARKELEACRKNPFAPAHRPAVRPTKPSNDTVLDSEQAIKAYDKEGPVFEATYGELKGLIHAELAYANLPWWALGRRRRKRQEIRYLLERFQGKCRAVLNRAFTPLGDAYSPSHAPEGAVPPKSPSGVTSTKEERDG